MPIYEYEPDGHDCLMCEGRVAAIQGINEEPLSYCPDCGLKVRRVISKASFKMAKGGADEAAKRGFTTFKRAEAGIWEKVAGPGVDGIMATAEDRAAAEAEKSSPKRKVLDLDE